MEAETCLACRFRGSSYTLDDVRGTLRSLAQRWRWMIEGVDAELLIRRPAPETWSAAEYAAHSRDVTALMGTVLHNIVTRERPRFEPPPHSAASSNDPPASIDILVAIEELGANADRLSRNAGALHGDDWDRQAVIGDDVVDARWAVRHAVHDACHHLSDVGRGLRALGAGPPSSLGTLLQVSASAGGVPKLALERAEVDHSGLVGDRQAVRVHHGRPWQALCLWSADVIAAFQREGHPISPGAAGENLTIAGLDWSMVRPGVQLSVGPVLMEVTAYAEPCVANTRWFRDGQINCMSHDSYPGSSRVYAAVLRDGTVVPGDPVVLEPTQVA